MPRDAKQKADRIRKTPIALQEAPGQPRGRRRDGAPRERASERATQLARALRPALRPHSHSHSVQYSVFCVPYVLLVFVFVRVCMH